MAWELPDATDPRAGIEFTESAARHGIVEHFEPGESLDEHAASFCGEDKPIWNAAMRLMAMQAMHREWGLIERTVPGDLPDTTLTLLLALMIVGRDLGDGVQLQRGETLYGDDTTGMQNLAIEPAAKHGDFDIDLLLTYSEYGPSAEWERGERGPDVPSSRTISGRLALVRDDHGAGHYKDRSLTRNALRDAKIMVMPYTTYEVERDVFALARRAYEDLVRHVTDTAD